MEQNQTPSFMNEQMEYPSWIKKYVNKAKIIKIILTVLAFLSIIMVSIFSFLLIKDQETTIHPIYGWEEHKFKTVYIILCIVFGILSFIVPIIWIVSLARIRVVARELNGSIVLIYTSYIPTLVIDGEKQDLGLFKRHLSGTLKNGKRITIDLSPILAATSLGSLEE